MTRSPVTRYERTISSGRGKSGSASLSAIGSRRRLVEEALDERRQLVEQIQQPAAQRAEEISNGLARLRGVVPDRDEYEGDGQVDQYRPHTYLHVRDPQRFQS